MMFLPLVKLQGMRKQDSESVKQMPSRRKKCLCIYIYPHCISIQEGAMGKLALPNGDGRHFNIVGLGFHFYCFIYQCLLGSLPCG